MMYVVRDRRCSSVLVFTTVSVLCVSLQEYVYTNHPRRAGPVPRGGTNTSLSRGHTSLHSDNGTGCYKPAHRSPVDKLERERGEQ